MKIQMNAKWKNVGQLVAQMIMDTVMVNVSFLLALYLRFDMRVQPIQLERFARLWPIMTVFFLGSFWFAKIYKCLWKYASMDEALRILIGTIAGTGLTYAFSMITYAMFRRQNPFLIAPTAYPIGALLCFVLVSGQRFSIRLMNQLGVKSRSVTRDRRRRVMVVGAGWAGASLLREMAARGFREGEPVIMIDDDPKKIGTRIGRVPVVGDIHSIPECASKYDIDDIVIAIPSANSVQFKEIMQYCADTACKLKVVPNLREVTGGNEKQGALRDVRLSDLLSHGEVKLDMALIRQTFTGATVLVTGGGGSIGSELCRRIAMFAPSRIVVLDAFENSAVRLMWEMNMLYSDRLDIAIELGSVTDEKRVSEVFDKYTPDVVIHAAAYKSVALLEDCPAQAIETNVLGLVHVARAADRCGVKRFLYLSSDKAVNPTNVYGATKRAGELFVSYMARHSKTAFVSLRFGNVLGTDGDAVQRFRTQIRGGGPVTVTHPDITRYYSTLEEVSELALESISIGKSGDIMLIDMGAPVRIVDLARNMIFLSGYTVDEDIKIVFTGLRAGEKLFEEATMAQEVDKVEKTRHERLSALSTHDMDEAGFVQKLDAVTALAGTDADAERVRAALTALVPSYRQKLRKIV